MEYTVKNIAGAVKASLEKSMNEIQTTTAEIASLEDKRKSGRYSRETLRDEIIPAISAAKSRLEAQKRAASADAKAIIDAFRQKVDDDNQLNPAEITDDIKLLQSGLPLYECDLKAMLSRNANNKTMSQLILRYAEEREMYNVGRYIGGTAERQLADSLDGITDSFVNQWIDSQEDAAEMLGSYFTDSE